MSDVFALLLADLTYSGDWEGAVEMRTEHGWVDVLDRVIELRDDLHTKVKALIETTEKEAAKGSEDGNYTYATILRVRAQGMQDVLDLLNGSST